MAVRLWSGEWQSLQATTYQSLPRFTTMVMVIVRVVVMYLSRGCLLSSSLVAPVVVPYYLYLFVFHLFLVSSMMRLLGSAQRSCTFAETFKRFTVAKLIHASLPLVVAFPVLGGPPAFTFALFALSLSALVLLDLEFLFELHLPNRF